MSFQVNVPPSVVAKITKSEEVVDEATEKKKREDWRKIKELEEARKAGTAPAMKDEGGKDINPHIPQYIMQAPWYTGALRPTLMHQREPDEMKPSYSSMNVWYQKGKSDGKVGSTFKKGACENCGAMGHTKKTCLEYPRKVGAKYTGTFAPDDYEQKVLSLSYDGKRDRWNGYDPSEHKKIIEEFQKIEEVKRELKGSKLDTSLCDGENGDNVMDEEDEDGDKYADDIAMPGQKFETKQRITVRNLRIREDTAKYLYNLDVESAFYDPKTRAMRCNPFDGTKVDPKELPYAGDNFVRWSGEAHDTLKKQMFAWEAYSKGTDINIQADPTKLELLHREYQKKKEAYKDSARESILEKYGGQEHLDAPPKEFLLGQNEEYIEYSRYGTQIKGNKKPTIRSRYKEDIVEKNHTAVWGSYWEAGRWGYKCCYSLVRGSYCIGEAGHRLKIQEGQEDDDRRMGSEITDKVVTDNDENKDVPIKSIIESNSLYHQHLERLQAEEKRKEKQGKKRKKSRRRSSSTDPSESSDDGGSKHKKSRHEKKKSKKHKKHKKNRDDDDDGNNKVEQAIEKEKRRQKEVDRMMKIDEKDRQYNVMYDSKGPTEEDIEAYRKLQMRPEDPMANYFKKNF